MKKVLEIDDCTLCPHHTNHLNEFPTLYQMVCFHPSCCGEDMNGRRIKDRESLNPPFRCDIPFWCPLDSPVTHQDLLDKLARKEIQFQKAAAQDYCSICGKILDGYKGE